MWISTPSRLISSLDASSFSPTNRPWYHAVELIQVKHLRLWVCSSRLWAESKFGKCHYSQLLDSVTFQDTHDIFDVGREIAIR